MTDPNEPAVKGALVANGLRALKSAVAADAFAAFIPTLSPAAQRLINEPPLAADWVPLALRFEIFDRAFDVLLAKKLEAMYQIGLDAHANTFKTVYKTFIKLFSPKFLLARVKPAWQVNVRNCGTLEAIDDGDDWLMIEYRGAPMPAPWFWEYNRGGMAGLAMVTRVKNARSTIVSGGGTEPNCAIRIEWDR